MKIDFKALDPNNLSEKAIIFLEKATGQSVCDFFDLNDYIEAAKQRKSLIFGAFDGENMVGCFTIDLKAGKGRKVIILSLLGGEHIKLWRDDLVKFLFDMAKQNKCTDFSMLGRKGFGKLFPELTLDGCIYSRKLI